MIVPIDIAPAEFASAAEYRRDPVRRRPRSGDIVLWFLVAILLIVTLFPFYWSLRTALSTNAALPASSRSLLPADFSFGGFERALGLATTAESIAAGGSGAEINFLRALFNSFVVSAWSPWVRCSAVHSRRTRSPA